MCRKLLIMEKILLIPRNLEKFFENKSLTFDFENNPFLFPLYLFDYFHKKYSKNQVIEKEGRSYYSRQSVYCKYEEPLLSEGYKAWFIASTKWNHVSFFLQIGKEGFIPFTNALEYAEGLISYIQIQVFADKISIFVNMNTCFDFSVLSCCNKISEDITTEIKKYPGLSKLIKAP